MKDKKRKKQRETAVKIQTSRVERKVYKRAQVTTIGQNEMATHTCLIEQIRGP